MYRLYEPLVTDEVYFEEIRLRWHIKTEDHTSNYIILERYIIPLKDASFRSQAGVSRSTRKISRILSKWQEGLRSDRGTSIHTFSRVSTQRAKTVKLQVGRISATGICTSFLSRNPVFSSFVFASYDSNVSETNTVCQIFNRIIFIQLATLSF